MGGRRFAKGTDGVWAAADVPEVAAGDADASEFLDHGLGRDFEALTVHSDDTGAVGQAVDVGATRATLAAYGLAADAGDADLVGALYTADTVVDIAGDRVYCGRDSMAEMIRGEFHRSLLPWGGSYEGAGIPLGQRQSGRVGALWSHLGAAAAVGDGLGGVEPPAVSLQREPLGTAARRRWALAGRQAPVLPGSGP
jgi:hypothetical protein